MVLSPVIYSFGFTDYQKGRIQSWFSSEGNISERWNILQSEISIGSGELFGEGFLKSKQNQFNFLPEADTDFIFSIYAEQFGFVGVLLIFILIAIFIILSIIVLLQEQSLSEDLSTYYLGAYFIFVIGFSFLINILMVSGMIPVVGLPLPFFTKGGSSLLCFSIMLGFIFFFQRLSTVMRFILLLLISQFSMADFLERKDVQTFISETVKSTSLTKQEVENYLSRAEIIQRVIRSRDNQPEVKFSWNRYRNIF